MWDRLLVDCNIATMEGGGLGLVENGAIGIADGRIVRVGKRTELAGYRAGQVDALGGAWVTPGLIDCHTHLVFAGNRADEHAMRRAGRRTPRTKPSAPAFADGRRLHHGRGEVRLRPRPKERASAAEDRQPSR